MRKAFCNLNQTNIFLELLFLCIYDQPVSHENFLYDFYKFKASSESAFNLNTKPGLTASRA